MGLQGCRASGPENLYTYEKYPPFRQRFPTKSVCNKASNYALSISRVCAEAPRIS